MVLCPAQGSGFFLGGLLLVVWGWAVVGMLVEAYGFWLLFAGFFPTVLSFLRRIPVLGRALDLPMLKSVRPALQLARPASSLVRPAYSLVHVVRASIMVPALLCAHVPRGVPLGLPSLLRLCADATCSECVAPCHHHGRCVPLCKGVCIVPAGAEQDSAGAVAACIGAQACGANATLLASSAGGPQSRMVQARTGLANEPRTEKRLRGSGTRRSPHLHVGVCTFDWQSAGTPL